MNSLSLPGTALESIRLGHTVVPIIDKNLIADVSADVTTFFSKKNSYKQQFINPGKTEWGYYELTHKESFAVRNQQLPNDLLRCKFLFDKARELTLACLAIISEQMQWDPSLLTNLTKESVLPSEGKSSSLLRVLHYHASHENNFSCATHQDLGLLSIVFSTENPALETYDYMTNEWIAIEKETQPFNAIIMVGETLSALSNGFLLPCTHRVKSTEQARTSLVFQLRADPNTLMDSSTFETPITGKFSKPFKLTGEEFYQNEIKHRSSVNGSY